ncbi:MAG: DUF5675 family protein [Staphylococcus sp.]|nr:DUF5675 family protein [Staphylococcus sp.]
MKLTLYRKFLGKDYTIGKLFVNGEYFCDTLEDTVRPEGEKIPGKTAIPYGTYDVILTMSPKFKRVLPLLLNVPNFEGIRIHNGNSASDSSGCILVGFNKQKGMVLNSKDTLNILMFELNIANVKQEKITIEVQ